MTMYITSTMTSPGTKTAKMSKWLRLMSAFPTLQWTMDQELFNVFSPYGQSYQNHDQTNKQFCLVGMKESLWHMVDVLLRRLKIYVP